MRLKTHETVRIFFSKLLNEANIYNRHLIYCLAQKIELRGAVLFYPHDFTDHFLFSPEPVNLVQVHEAVKTPTEGRAANFARFQCQKIGR